MTEQRRTEGTPLSCRIQRDAEGIPWIEGDGLAEVFEGLGWMHAQDRGLQLCLMRILGRGRATELLRDTDELLAWDLYFRRLVPSAEATLDDSALPEPTRTLLRAYCRGLNAWFARHPLPWELRLLRVRWEPWTPADTFLIGKMLGYVGLAEGQLHIERWILDCLRRGISPAMLEELFPGKFEGLNLELIRALQIQDSSIYASPTPVEALVPSGQGSNNWVVSGRHTTSGAPILCNDPHLQINRLPQLWYEVVLRWRTPEGLRYAAGATVPGLPTIAIGRTPDLAWGVTYAFIDAIDSWIEEYDGHGRYRRGEEWIPFQVRTETIRRRNRPPLTVRFYENPHGILQSNPDRPGLYLATKWAVETPVAIESLDAFCSLLTAKTVEEARRCLVRVNNGAWNWVIADRAGHIGFQMSGRVPIRPNGWSGLFPVPGWDPQWDWQGFAPPEAMAGVTDPPDGIFITANNDLSQWGQVPCVNISMGTYRADRIRELLETHRPLSLDRMRQIQLDLYSPQAAAYMVHLRPILQRWSSRYPEATQALLNWDLRYTLDSPGAALFERFYRALVIEVLGMPENLGQAWAQALVEKTSLVGLFFAHLDRVLLAEHSLWFHGKTRTQLYEAALQKTFSRPVTPLRDERKVRLEHPLLGKIPVLGRLFSRMIELPGCRVTIPQGQILPGQNGPIAVSASFRFLTDLGSDEVWQTLPGGINDRPFSRWFANRLRLWQQGRCSALYPQKGPKATQMRKGSEKTENHKDD